VADEANVNITSNTQLLHEMTKNVNLPNLWNKYKMTSKLTKCMT